MTYRIDKVTYYIIEKESREIHDTPVIGASRSQNVGQNKHGPYFQEIEAQKKLKQLEKRRAREGWKRSQEGRLYKGDNDLSMSIKEEVQHLGDLEILLKELNDRKP